MLERVKDKAGVLQEINIGKGLYIGKVLNADEQHALQCVGPLTSTYAVHLQAALSQPLVVGTIAKTTNRNGRGFIAGNQEHDIARGR